MHSIVLHYVQITIDYNRIQLRTKQYNRIQYNEKQTGGEVYLDLFFLLTRTRESRPANACQKSIKELSILT